MATVTRETTSDPDSEQPADRESELPPLALFWIFLPID